MCSSEEPAAQVLHCPSSLLRQTLQKSGDADVSPLEDFPSAARLLGNPGAQLGFNLISWLVSPLPLFSDLGFCVCLCPSPISARFRVLLPVRASPHPHPQLSLPSPSFSFLFLSVSLETGLVAWLPSAAFFYEVEIRWHLIDRRSLHGYQGDRVLGRDTFSSLGLSDHS